MNNYVVGKEIGSGAFCKVKVAWCRCTQKMVAIKDLRKTADNRIILKKYLPKEASIVRRLIHPHILRTYHILETPNNVLYVLELAENGDLLDYVEARGHISEPEARFVFRQILEGIGFCHMEDIAHRDIKCENIMLDRNMDVKIGDFGLATERCSAVSTPCGSLDYAAPELRKSSLQNYDGKKADIWSLGILLYVLLHGRFPVRLELAEARAVLPPSHASHVTLCSYYFMRYIMNQVPNERPSIQDLQDAMWVNIKDARRPPLLSNTPKFTIETHLIKAHTMKI